MPAADPENDAPPSAPGPRHGNPAELPTGGWNFRLLSCEDRAKESEKNGPGPWGHGEGAGRDHAAAPCGGNLSRHLRRSSTSTFIIPTIHSFSHIPGSIGRPPRAALSAFLGHLARRLGARVATPVGQPHPTLRPSQWRSVGSLSTQVVAIRTAGAEDHTLTLRRLRSSVVEAPRGEAPPERIEPE